MASLKLWTLGPFRAEFGDDPLTEFRTNKVRALLIYLAVEQTPQARQDIMNLLWPGLPDRSAKANL